MFRVTRVTYGRLHYHSGQTQQTRTTWTQPAWSYFKANAYHRLHKLTDPVARRLERPLLRRHERRCFTCIALAQGKTPTVECGYLQLTIRRDVRCAELKHAGRKEISVLRLGGSAVDPASPSSEPDRDQDARR